MFFRCLGLMIITIASRSFQSCFIVQFWYGANTDRGVFYILFCSSLHLFCTIVWFFIFYWRSSKMIKKFETFYKRVLSNLFLYYSSKAKYFPLYFFKSQNNTFSWKKKILLIWWGLSRQAKVFFFKRFILNTCIKVYLK